MHSDRSVASSWGNSPKSSAYDAVVVGSGPNGLAAAITIAQAGHSVLVVEGASEPGGGTRTRELTLPGFRHDLCSAVFPMAQISPFFRGLDLKKRGLRWLHPEVLAAHPLDGGGEAPALMRDVGETAATLGVDERAYRELFGALEESAEDIFSDLLRPMLRVPRHPLATARFGLRALLPSSNFGKWVFSGERARALFAGNAAHSVVPLETPMSASIGMMLMLAGHVGGWPIAEGGAASIWQALVAELEALGGEVICDCPVSDLEGLPRARAYLFDTSPQAMVDIAKSRLPLGYRRRVSGFSYGAGIFKMDVALSQPIPWLSENARRAGTVHVGGTAEEVASAERVACGGGVPNRPFLLVSQPSVIDPTRAPEGQHVGWIYGHAPAGVHADMREQVISQIERFAPGFRDCLLAEHLTGSPEVAAANPNNVGGDITGGANTPIQLLARPILSANPYATPAKDIFLCSASTPPGGGVHGLCGWRAAQSALRRL